MSTVDEQPVGFVEMPQYSIVSEKNPAGQLIMKLRVTFGMAIHEFYLCDTKTYEQVARTIHKGIMDAGVAMKRAESGIIVAKGMPNGFHRPAKSG